MPVLDPVITITLSCKFIVCPPETHWLKVKGAVAGLPAWLQPPIYSLGQLHVFFKPNLLYCQP
jgi:hypothetical protein